MQLTVRRAAAGLLASGLLVLTSAGSAFAASPAPSKTAPSAPPLAQSTACAGLRQAARADPTVGNLKALGDCEINRRFTTLDTLAARVQSATVLTAGARTALAAEISGTQSGLTALKGTIDADTTVAQLRIDLPKIATQYRVYLLVAPQVNLVIGADAETVAIGKFQTLAANLAGRIAEAKANGRDVTAAQADLDAMDQNVATAQTQVGPLVAGLLPLTPAQWNAGTAGPVLRAARSTEASARDLLRAARDDAAACVAALR